MPNQFEELIAPRWAIVDGIAHPANAPPRPVQFFANLRGPKKRKLEPAAEGMFDDDYLKLLLSGVQEIFEVPCFIGGPALVERQLGAKVQKSPVFVTMTHPDVRANFNDYAQFLQKFEELGWGAHQEARPGDKRYWNKFNFKVRGFTVTLAISTEVDKFDDYSFNINMIRYSLEHGWEQDPRSKKDFDKHKITCNKKVEEALLVKLMEEKVVPYYTELTGKKFSFVQKGK